MTLKLSDPLMLGFGLALAVGCASPETSTNDVSSAETRAIEFLKREVPAWSRENGCYSCHNNGDAARALYAAAKNGYRLSGGVLSNTTAWVAQPERWDHNKGDPGFSDKRLANIQFAASLISAVAAGETKKGDALERAAKKVAGDQGEDGAWRIDPQNTVGSPATYGTTLATYTAWRILKENGGPGAAMRKAETWLWKAQPKNITDAATLLRASADSWQFARHQAATLETIRNAQTKDGGWGPYPDSPPQVFDTALVLLALAPIRSAQGVNEMIARGREFLIKEQDANGSWPPTTRPPGGESYAQRVSTTGWATLALLETRSAPAPSTR